MKTSRTPNCAEHYDALKLIANAASVEVLKLETALLTDERAGRPFRAEARTKLAQKKLLLEAVTLELLTAY